MSRVHEMIDNQSENMLEIQRIVAEVMEGISNSLVKIEQIGVTTIQLEDSRNRIVELLED